MRAEERESRPGQQEAALSDRYRLNHSQTLYRGRVIDLTVDRITTASGTQAVREVVVHPGGAAVVPVFSNGDVLLVEQFRYPMQQSLLELPAGKIDPGESPEETAARELQEEVGFRAGRLEKLVEFYTTPGFCNELLHLFLATDLKPGRRAGDEDEELSVHRYSPKQLEKLIRLGKIVDAKTLIGLHLLLANPQCQAP